MLAHLLATQFPLRAKKPIYSVGQAMSKLEQRGKIRIVKRGAGNSPNVYKGKATAETPQTEDHSRQEGDIVGTTLKTE